MEQLHRGSEILQNIWYNSTFSTIPMTSMANVSREYRKEKKYLLSSTSPPRHSSLRLALIGLRIVPVISRSACGWLGFGGRERGRRQGAVGAGRAWPEGGGEAARVTGRS
jgi:hypothetical protein